MSDSNKSLLKLGSCLSTITFIAGLVDLKNGVVCGSFYFSSYETSKLEFTLFNPFFFGVYSCYCFGLCIGYITLDLMYLFLASYSNWFSGISGSIPISRTDVDIPSSFYFSWVIFITFY